MKRVAIALGTVLGVYLVGRGVAELFVVDMSDPASYRDDWGGPTLAGVLAVHIGPALVSAALLGSAVRRRLQRRKSVALPAGPR